MQTQTAAETKSAAATRMAGVLYRQGRLVVALALMLCLGFGGTGAAVSSSNNYQVTETQFGPGSSQNDCSENYCAQTSAGDTVAGSISSDNYGASAGSDSTDIPTVEVLVTDASHDLGVLSATATATATSTIAVRTYLSNGYVMQITGSPPKQGSHAIIAMGPAGQTACPCTSHPGAEQFGINFANNTSPDIGAAPVQLPSGDTIFGQAETNYNQPDLFTYEDGAVVAHSDTSGGQTVYTMSMILNISNVTPGGRYQGALSAVVVPLY